MNLMLISQIFPILRGCEKLRTLLDIIALRRRGNKSVMSHDSVTYFFDALINGCFYPTTGPHTRKTIAKQLS